MHDEVSPIKQDLPRSYAQAGVDIAKAERTIALLRAGVHATAREATVGAFGAFGAAVRSPGSDHLLVSSADGVGTKVCLVRTEAEAAGIGRDLVHHCINDILTCGARPLFFLDYLAFSQLEPSFAAALVSGMANACAAHGCALVGGETAQMPDLYREGAFDVAGFIVGTVSADRFLDGSSIRVGDSLVGIASAGLHTNGYSLARRLLADRLEEPLGSGSIRQVLLAEHRCYLQELAPVLDEGLAHGLAHITGGGLPGNVPRMLPEGLAANVHIEAMPRPAIFEVLLGYGLDREEMYRTFNMGIGMVVACSPKNLEVVLEALPGALPIGEVVEQRGAQRVVGIS